MGLQTQVGGPSEHAVQLRCQQSSTFSTNTVKTPVGHERGVSVSLNKAMGVNNFH